MIGRDEYLDKLRKAIGETSMDKKKFQDVALKLYEKHNVPMDMSMEYLTSKYDIIIAPPEFT